MNYSIQPDTLPHHIMENPDEDDFYRRLDEIVNNLSRDTPYHNTFSETPEHEEPQTPYHQPIPQEPEEELEHLMLVMESKIMRRFNDLEAKLNSFSFKQMKRKRTGANRCKALNRKGQVCNGYVCKNKSKHLCYAHYVLIDKQKERANYLYSKKQ